MIKLNLTDRTMQARFGRFVLVGGLVAVVHFSSLALVKEYWRADIAFTSAFVLATFTHYNLNKLWALPSARSDTGRQFGEYLLTVGLSYLINISFFNIGHSWLGLSIMWASVLGVPFSSLVVFLILNFRVFRA